MTYGIGTAVAKGSIFVLLLSVLAHPGSSAAQELPSFEPRGRLHTDAVLISNENLNAGNTAFVRRARLGVSGHLAPSWGFQVEFDFAEDEVSTNDVFLERTLPVGSLKIGQTKVPFSMNELSSSNRIAFIERASPSNAFADARRLGANYAHFGERLGLQAMAYTRAIGDERDLPLGIGGRLTASPRLGPEHRFHAGISGTFERMDRWEAASFSDRPEGRVEGGAVRLVNVGIDSDVSSVRKTGLEGGYQNGPLTVETEFFRVAVNRNTGLEPTFNGFYAQATYTLTGESRGYGGGTFRAVSPSSGLGAWEVGARFSHVDLNHQGFQGGEQNNLTLGLTWAASDNVRFMANVVRALSARLS